MKVGFSWTVLGRTSLRFKIQTLRSGPTVDAGVSSARVRQTDWAPGTGSDVRIRGR